jgi:putative transposase
VVLRVGAIFGLKAEVVVSVGKQPHHVGARSVACFWAVRELGMTTVEVSRRLGITQSAVTKAVYRGEKLVQEKDLQMISAVK